jgi:thymidine kinase
MNSGKSTALLQAAFNYEERGMKVLIIKPDVDSKGENAVVSRLGISRNADIMLPSNADIVAAISAHQPVNCVLVDEAQFIHPNQVDALFWYAVTGDVPVLAYGLRTDFSTVAFPGAARLLELAHELQELKTICRCGRKAILNGRKLNGEFVFSGDQVVIDDDSAVEYESLCGRCYLKFKQAAV